MPIGFALFIRKYVFTYLPLPEAVFYMIATRMKPVGFTVGSVSVNHVLTFSTEGRL